MAENPERHALTTIFQKRFQAVQTQQEAGEPILIQKLLGMGQAERRQFWDDQFRKCIRCLGCIDMCPVYPAASEGLNPTDWMRGGELPPPYPLFHLIRAYHVGDACILCGECEQACPAQIPLKTLQDLVRHLPPEKVFEMVPGLGKEARDAIVENVNRRETASERMSHAA